MRQRCRRGARPSAAILVCLALLACSDEPPTDFEEILVVADPSAPQGVGIAQDRFVDLLAKATKSRIRVETPRSADPTGAPLVFLLGSHEAAEPILPRAVVDRIAPEGYALRRKDEAGRILFAAAGPDPLGTQYAIYALLETLGFGFFHPEQTFVPPRLELPSSLDSVREPDYRWRGFHVHTMHPIELMDSLLVEGEEHVAEAERYLDWLVANRQNYLQWVLLDTVDLDACLRHARRIVDRAHARGLRVGIDTPFQFVQQNAFVLVPDASSPWQPQIEQRLARVLEVPFDVVNVELGATEFVPADDEATMQGLDSTADLLDRVYGVELLAKVHVTEGQSAPHFGGINFNFLPGISDPRVGVMPHSVQFYDLFRPAPTYGNEDFSHIREFLLEEIGERTVLYYPETAYWVTFDVDVPLFLPHYVFSRWNDLARLVGSGMDGQIDFSSGFEWGYWLGDWVAASSAYDAAEDWREKIGRFSRIFGPRAEGMQRLLDEIVTEQGEDLLGKNLVAYLIGWDPADDIGHYAADTHFQPVRPLPEEIARMGEEDLSDLEEGALGDLAELEGTYDRFADRAARLADGIPSAAEPWVREIAESLEVTRLRVRHARALLEGVVASRRSALGGARAAVEAGRARDAFLVAQAARRKAQSTIARREGAYRWPVERIARPRENPTAYEFGYLYTVSDAYYWKRDEIRAIEPTFCICEGNLVNLVDTALGEGWLGDLVEHLPPLPGCLDACVHPVERIREPAGPGEERTASPRAGDGLPRHGDSTFPPSGRSRACKRGAPRPRAGDELRRHGDSTFPPSARSPACKRGAPRPRLQPFDGDEGAI